MFAQRLKQCRLQRGLSVREFSEKLCAVERTVQYWKQGKRECDFKTLMQISNILEESIDYLLGND